MKYWYVYKDAISMKNLKYSGLLLKGTYVCNTFSLYSSKNFLRDFFESPHIYV